MDTSYKGGIPLLNGGNGETSGIDYIQLFVAPTIAWKVTSSQNIGASVILGYQRFKATGINNFTESLPLRKTSLMSGRTTH